MREDPLLTVMSDALLAAGIVLALGLVGFWIWTIRNNHMHRRSRINSEERQRRRVEEWREIAGDNDITPPSS